MIHYHGTPMTPNADMVKAFAAKHAMVSFWEPRQIEVAAEICQSIVLDNGAFSAWRQGVAHDFDGYVSWATDWIRHPAVDWCVIPDVIDGDEAANDKLLDAWRMEPNVSVPVFHMHESIGRLQRLAIDFPRVALGSSGQFATVGSPSWWGRMHEMMEAVCDTEGRPICKFHGLRMLNPVVFSHIPLSSADSCNVARNAGIDQKWTGSYAPKSRAMRAAILMERIESHASAARWSVKSKGVETHEELYG